MSETEIIEGCQRFDRSAQSALYQRHADELLSISLRYMGDMGAAQDNLHDALVKVFERIPQYRPGQGALMAWMSRIVINEALQKHRRSKRVLFDSERVADSGVAVPFCIFDHLAAEEMLMLLQQLPEGCRLVFNLKEIEGFSHIEIGRMLGITASASRAQLAKAKQRLRQLLSIQEKGKMKKVS